MKTSDTIQLLRPNHALWRGRRLLYFGGCDYFRLASDPRVLKAVADGMKRFGLNVAASRRTTGNHPLYPQLERELAKTFGSEAALLVGNGYMTNLVAAQALAGTFSHVLMDERAHASQKDAAQLLGCPVITFKHRDVSAFEAALLRCGKAARPAVLTDGMFSHDGSVAPLADYLKLLPKDGLLIVDDAHGAGILGTKGRGTVELARVPRARIVQCVTLSKAFGVHGGALICSRALQKQFAESRMFIGSTPLPLPMANAALCSLKIVSKARTDRARLQRNVALVRRQLAKAGIVVPQNPGPIVALHLHGSAAVNRLKRALLDAGILPPFVNYMTSSAGGYFRFVISSEHTNRELERLTKAICGGV